MSYTAMLKQPKDQVRTIPIKPVTYLHGEPQVIRDQHEVDQMIVNKNLEYFVVGNFFYGWPEIHELLNLIPK